MSFRYSSKDILAASTTIGVVFIAAYFIGKNRLFLKFDMS